ncbi:MAG: hypothetical protein HKN91_18185 [Acidimicrobiia bacterium]|nr:hypothetical protein [Acidimicrobiia bacterium]
MVVTRIVSTSETIDIAHLAQDLTAMRIAPDELMILGDVVEFGDWTHDPHAIVFADTGWAGVWLGSEQADEFLLSECEWQLPSERPAFAQGMVSHLAVKLWLEDDRTLILVPSAMSAELEARLAR